MFKYDFIILYEHKNRELENAVLLAMMLEKKGYKVAIEFRRSGKILFQKAEVMLVPYLYNNESVLDFAIQPFCHYKKIINLQYEQIFSYDSEKLGVFMPREEARKAEHVAWGIKPAELMRKNGISNNNIHTIGHVSIDLNFPKYNKVFYNKEFLGRKYGLPIDKNWRLFISSFSYVGLSDEEFKQLEVLTNGIKEIYDLRTLSLYSQKELFKWFEKVLIQNDDVFIYRPHPQEIENRDLIRLTRKYKNFYCISDYSIRQWIRVCDTLFAWYSTSIVDAYYSNKACAILCPVNIPHNIQYPILSDQKFVVDYDTFNNIYTQNMKPKLNGKTISEYYCNNPEAKSFEKLVDLCETIYNKKDGYDFARMYKYSKLKALKIYIYKLLMSIASFVDYGCIVPKKYRADIYHSHKEMYNINKEIQLYRKRFSRILKKL